MDFRKVIELLQVQCTIVEIKNEDDDFVAVTLKVEVTDSFDEYFYRVTTLDFSYYDSGRLVLI
jgi:hypothetical protein